MKTRAIYRKIFVLGALTLCWLLMAPKPAPAAQKGLNIPPPTTTRAAPKVEPPPPAPPQWILKVRKMPAPVQGPQPEPPTLPRAAIGGVKMQKPSAEYGGARDEGQQKSFFDIPKGPGAAGIVSPTDLKPPPGGIGRVVAPTDVNLLPGGAPGLPSPGMPKVEGSMGGMGQKAIIDDNMPRGEKLGNPIPPGIVPKVGAAAIIDDNKPGAAVAIVDDNKPGGDAGVVAPAELKPPPGGAPGGS